MESYPCPCCGYFTLDDWPGSFEICRICFWEDDPVQNLDPWFEGGPNRVPLIQAQANYAQFGAMERCFIEKVEPARATDRKDPTWRAVSEDDRALVRTPRELWEAGQGRDLDAWYYWRRRTPQGE